MGTRMSGFSPAADCEGRFASASDAVASGCRVEERSKRSDAQLSAASYHAIWGFGFRVLQKLSIFPRGNGGWSITDESVHHNVKLQA